MSASRPTSSRLIVALDLPTLDQAVALARAVGPHVGLVKVGLELFCAEGPRAVAACAEAAGRPVFLDLKLHDIAATVEAAARSAAAAGAAMLTVHASGGLAMLQAAVRGAGGRTRILGVTVLTSLGEGELAEVGLAGPIEAAVLRLARLCASAGTGGVVCSPREAAVVRAAVGPNMALVVPGIRPEGVDKGDQVRAATPERAVLAGADYLVVGRPVRDAPDPAEAARRIALAIEAAVPET